ncbi:MAG: hypothetical protein AB8B69_20400, partial [Chitinophagales bacterium]
MKKLDDLWCKKSLIYFFSIFLFSMSTLNAQNYVSGSVKIGGEIKNIQVEQVGDRYRLCTPFIGLNQEEFVLCTIVEFDSKSTNISSIPCNEEFTENCSGRIDNADCSWDGLCSGDLSTLPVAILDTPDFGDVSEVCINRLSITHFYSLQTLTFIKDVLGINPIADDVNNFLISAYSTRENGGSSTTNIVDGDCNDERTVNGVQLYRGEGANKHTICHEWGHVIDGYISSRGYNYFSGIHEGMADVWSNAIILYYEENGDINSFINAKPLYELKARNWKKNHRIYLACSIIPEETSLPQEQGATWYVPRTTHFRSGVLTRWFYLTSEGTDNENYQVTFTRLMNPENYDDDYTSISNHACNKGVAPYEVIQESRNFTIQGIGHWNTMRIIQEAEGIVDATLLNINYPDLRLATIQSSMNLFEMDPTEDYCNILRQVTESWYSVNVGDKMTADITAPDVICGGYDIEIEANHAIADEIRLYNANDPQNVITTVTANQQGEVLTLSHLQNTSSGDGDYHFILESDVSEIDGITLPANDICTLTQDIHVLVKQVLITSDDEPIICVGNTVTLTADAHPSVNITNYKWTKNGVFESEGLMNNTVSVNESVGVYDYVVEVSFLSNTGTVLIETASYTVE